MTAPLPKSRFRLIWRGLLVISLILGSCLLAAYSLNGPRPRDQEITFKHATPQLSPVATSHSKPPPWLRKTYEAFDTLKSKVTRLSNAPKTSPQLEQSVEFWYQKLLLRYPELTVPMRTVPDAENGFLQLLNLMGRLQVAGKFDSQPFPEKVYYYLEQKDPWDGEAAAKWLAENQAQVAEIRAIGLLPGRSTNGISIKLWTNFQEDLFRNFIKIMLLEARLAAERGDVPNTFKAVRAAYGLCRHLCEIENPNLTLYLLNITTQVRLGEVVIGEILPLFSEGQLDLVAWEYVMNLNPVEPTEYIRVLKGQWDSNLHQLLLPLILDPTSEDFISDGGDFLDFYYLRYSEACQVLEVSSIEDWLIHTTAPPFRDVSHLSAASRLAIRCLDRGLIVCGECLRYSGSINAMTRAAFAIMKGQPIPKEPVHGLDYGWDPSTRQLSFPAGISVDHEFLPITVPRFGSPAAR